MKEDYMDLISVLAGAIGVPAVNYIKGVLGWDGRKVLLISGVVSALLSLGVLVLTGQLTVESFTLDALVSSITLVFTTAQIVYRMIEG